MPVTFLLQQFVSNGHSEHFRGPLAEIDKFTGEYPGSTKNNFIEFDTPKLIDWGIRAVWIAPSKTIAFVPDKLELLKNLVINLNRPRIEFQTLGVDGKPRSGMLLSLSSPKLNSVRDILRRDFFHITINDSSVKSVEIRVPEEKILTVTF